MTPVEAFEEVRPLLNAISNRILGDADKADQAVRQAWLRLTNCETPPRSIQAYLSAVTTLISIDSLRSAQRRDEGQDGRWLPEPLPTEPDEDPQRSAELADAVSSAAMLFLIERLTPLERAAFLLREIFESDHRDIASALGRPEQECARLLARARWKVAPMTTGQRP